MVFTDPVSDMLTRLRNGAAVGKSEVNVPYSKLKESIAQVLASNGYLEDVKTSEDGFRKQLLITIAPENGNAKMTSIQRLSTPGRRWYVNAEHIPRVKNGRGIVIISTSKGVMTGPEARKQNIGGELICEVY